MRDLDEPDEAVRAAWRLVEAFRAPFALGDSELFSTASVGIAICAPDTQAGDAVREADTAMFVAKENGRDQVAVFNDDLRVAVSKRLAIEVDLRRALERGELEVWYQPEVDLTTHEVIAFEALLRWRRAEGVVWTAEAFVDVAEDTGMILDIGRWVLGQACETAAALMRLRPDRPPIMRVNVSALQLSDGGLVGDIDEAIARTGIDPRHLCVEITETALLRETSIARANLAGAHDRGVQVALDDFGTGYASLSYIRNYPVDVLKIDRSFVTNITTSDQDRTLVSGIIALATALGIAVTGEGVETPDQADLLRELGCPGAQGYLFSHAVPAEQVERLIGLPTTGDLGPS